MEKTNTGKSSSAAGPKERRWTLFECGAGEREFKTYEVRAIFQFLESTRSGTPRDQWLKGEPTPAWDHGTRGSSPFWLGEGRVPRGNVATPEIVVFGVGEPGFLQAGRGSAVGKTAQSTTAPPLRSF